MNAWRIFENAHVVTVDDEFMGYVATEDGVIREVGRGRAPEKGVDLAGDFLIPGLIELHTDHLEVHFVPRPKIEWPALSAVMAHDAQIASAGITTVFDALRVGNDYDDEKFGARMTRLATAVATAKADGVTRSDHFLHLRCEIACEDVVDEMAPFLGNSDVKLVSIMDHTPGQRQFTNVSLWKRYYAGKRGASDELLNRLIVTRQENHERYAASNRVEIASRCRAAGIAVASHDDATLAHVDEAVRDGASIAEFPTTESAARASHAAGLKVLMGAPNVVRGGSHSGNIAARELAEQGVLDVLSSDYVPVSLMMGAFALRDIAAIGELPGAIRLVTRNPADATGLKDRGEIAAGKRADLVRVSLKGDQPVVREVWREGRRVA